MCVCVVLFHYRSSKSDDVPLYETNNILNHLKNHVNQMQKVSAIAF